MRVLLAAIFTGLLISTVAVHTSAHAAGSSLATSRATSTLDATPCDDTDLDCNSEAEAGDANAYIRSVIFTGENNVFKAFAGILFAMLVYYGFRLVVDSRNDGATLEAVQAYSQAFVGALLVLGASYFAESFTDATVAQTTIVDTDPLETNVMLKIIDFLVRGAGVILALNVMIQGIRFIVAINDGNVESARKNLIQSLVGGMAIMIAAPIMSNIVPGGANPVGIQIVGISNFLATAFGFFTVLAFVISGFMLVVSVDESLKERARGIMLKSGVALAVVVASNGIIRVIFI